MVHVKIVYDDRLTAYLAAEREQRLTAEWQRESAHEAAAVAEGLCPVHRTVLHPVAMQYPVRKRGSDITGHCPPCGWYWFYDPDGQEAGWIPDHDPYTGAWKPPERPGRSLL